MVFKETPFFAERGVWVSFKNFCRQRLFYMARFSEEQKRIALLLIHGPKTSEDLNSQLNIPFNKLSDELKAMLKLGVIEKQGFPTKYSLKKNIASEVQKRKKIAETDLNRLRIRAFIEMQAIEEELLKKTAAAA